MKKDEYRRIATSLTPVAKKMLMSLPTDSWQTKQTVQLNRLGLVRLDVTKLVATKDGERVRLLICPRCTVVLKLGMTKKSKDECSKCGFIQYSEA